MSGPSRSLASASETERPPPAIGMPEAGTGFCSLPPPQAARSRAKTRPRSARALIPVLRRRALAGHGQLLDPGVADPPGGELAGADGEDHVRPAAPLADVLDVGARRPRWRGEVRMEDAELVALVLEEPHFRVVHAQLEAIGTRRRVAAGDVPLDDSIAED